MLRAGRTVKGMKRGMRYFIALGLGFIAYRIAIAAVPNTVGLLVSLTLGLAVAFGVWRLTAPKAS